MALFTTTTSNAAQTRSFSIDSPVSAASNATRGRALSTVSALTPTSNMAQSGALSNMNSARAISPLPESAASSSAIQNKAVSIVSSAPTTPPQLLVSAPPSSNNPSHDQYQADYAYELSDSVPLLLSDSNPQLDFDLGMWEMNNRHLFSSLQSRQSSPFWDMVDQQRAEPLQFDDTSVTANKPSVAEPVELDGQPTTMVPALAASTPSDMDALRSRSRSPAARGLSLNTRQIEHTKQPAAASAADTSGSSQQSNPWSTTRVSPLTNSSKSTTPSSASSMQRRRDAAKHVEKLRSEIKPA